MEFEATVRGHKATIQRIEEGISDGMEDAAESLVRSAESDAKDVLRDTRRIWRREVYHGFVTDVDSGKTEANARLANMAPHATVVERGATYTSEGPPVEALLPWVASHFGGTTGGFSDDDGGPGTPDTEDARESDADDETTDVDYGNFPDEFYGQKSAVEIAKDHESVDESWRFSHVTADIDRDERLLPGQRVVVELIDDTEEWEIVDYDRHNVRAKRPGEPDANATLIDIGSGNTPAIVAFEDVDEWSEDDYLESVSRGLEQIDYQYNVAAEAKYIQDDVELVFEKLEPVFENKKHFAQLSAQIGTVKDVDRTPYDTPFARNDPGQSTIGLYGHTNDDYGLERKENRRLETVFHEVNHAFHYSRGSETTSLSRNETLGWDSVKYYNENNSNLPWNYYEQGGPDEWTSDRSADIPHPNTYFLIKDNPEGESEIDKEGFYEPFDEWGDYIYNDALSQAEDSVVERELDPNEQDLFHPKFGTAQVGDEFKMEIYDSSTGETEVEFDVQLTELPRQVNIEEEYPEIASEYGAEEEQLAFIGDIKKPGQERPIIIHEDGQIRGDMRVTEYHKEVKEQFEYDDGVEDPGFVSDDDYEQLTEGINRALFRGMIRSEASNLSSSATPFVNRSAYHATNGHESSSGLAEIWWTATLPEDKGGVTDSFIVELFEQNPDLAYAAARYFGVPDRVKQTMQSAWGMDWNEILREIDPDFSI
jgi:hypothetical protein